MPTIPQLLEFPAPPSPIPGISWMALRELFLKTLDSAETQRSYARSIDEFQRWYIAAPRAGFTRAVVAEWRASLVERELSAVSINVRLAAVRRLAQEAAENGLITMEIADAINRIRGAKSLGQRTGNWLTLQQAQALLRVPNEEKIIGARDRAILALLIGCGLRRSEVANLTMEHIQQRENRWCIVDLLGKHRRIRTVPMPIWVKAGLDAWTGRAGVTAGRVFRCVEKADQVYGDQLSEKAIYRVVQQFARNIAPGIGPHDLRRTCAKLCRAEGGELEQIQILLGHASIQTTERYLGTDQDFVHAPNDAIRLRL